MKRFARLGAAALLLPALLVAVAAQTDNVKVTAEKVTYERKGADVPDHKRTFEVSYPRFSGISDRKVRAALEETVSFWKNFDMTLEENLGDYHWLERLDHEVRYNKNSILVLDLIMEGTGAYPDGVVKTLVVDLRTGRRIHLRDVFTNIGPLLVKIDAAQKKEKTDFVEELRRTDPEMAADARMLLEERKYTSNVLEEFSIDDNGVTFKFDYGYPHAVKALEPPGLYFFSWDEMRPHVRPDRQFGRFVRK